VVVLSGFAISVTHGIFPVFHDPDVLLVSVIRIVMVGVATGVFVFGSITLSTTFQSQALNSEPDKILPVPLMTCPVRGLVACQV
jgi:hypothetical protein